MYSKFLQRPLPPSSDCHSFFSEFSHWMVCHLFQIEEHEVHTKSGVPFLPKNLPSGMWHHVGSSSQYRLWQAWNLPMADFLHFTS